MTDQEYLDRCRKLWSQFIHGIITLDEWYQEMFLLTRDWGG